MFQSLFPTFMYPKSTFLNIFETKASFHMSPFGFQWFLSTSFYYHSFSRQLLDQKGTLGLYLDQNIVLKCFDTEIFYYGSKGFFWLGLYHSFTLYSKHFPHMFWLQNLSFEFKCPLACFGPKMKFWLGFET